MGACKSCSRVILVLINILFSLIGIVLLVVGSIVRWGTDIMETYLSDLYNDFSKELDHISDADLSKFDIADLISDVTLSFIIIGAFFFIIGILGCIGACCTVRPMLIMYVVILTILVLAEIAFVVVLVAAESKVDEWLKKPFKSTLEDYRGIDGNDAVTLGLNFIMSQYDCCGVENYEDFSASSKWNRTFVQNSTDTIQNKSIPAVCCKDVSDQDCWLIPTTNNSYKDNGCYSAIKDWLSDNMAPLIGTSAGILAVEIILVIFACVACSKQRKEDDFDDNDSYNRRVLDNRSFDRVATPYDNNGYRGPHHNRQPYNAYDDGGPRGGYQNKGYDGPNGYRRDRQY